MAVARRQRIGWTLINEETGAGRIQLIRHSRQQRIRKVDQAPALEIDRIGDGKCVVARRARAVDQHRLQQCRAGRRLQCVREEILHQRQHARHVRRRHARPGLVTVIWTGIGIGWVECTDGLVKVAQYLKIIPNVVRRHDEDVNVVIDWKTVGVPNRTLKTQTLQGLNARNVAAAVGGNGNLVVGGHKIISARIGWIRKMIQRHKNRQVRGKRHRRKIVGHDLNHHAHGVCGNGEFVVIYRVGIQELVVNLVEAGIRWIVICQLVPLFGAGGNNKRPRRHHVRFESPISAFRENAHIATR